MRASYEQINEYMNQQYLTCRQAGLATHVGQTALIYALDNVDCRGSDFIWLYDRSVEIQMVSPLPDPATVVPGTVLVIGKRYGIPPTDLQEFVGLAYRTNSAASLRITTNAGQLPAAASFCLRCE